MDDPVSACERLEEIARVAQVSKPTWTQLLSRRNSIEAKHFVPMCEQFTNNKLSQSPAAACNDDSFHLRSLSTALPLSSPTSETVS